MGLAEETGRFLSERYIKPAKEREESLCRPITRIITEPRV